ncbi:MAG: cell surface protein SprA, partial [Ignavibacteriaceae bacterium]|nr:cell surface protein SprA [Ignavibacteriaceae bacterium]
MTELNRDIWLQVLLRYYTDANPKDIVKTPAVKKPSGFQLPLNALTQNNNVLAVPDSILGGVDSTFNANADSLFIPQDSTGVKDTVKFDPRSLDSTSRLKYFRFQREDRPYITLGRKKESKFFASPPETTRKRVITIDSTGKFVEIKELIAGKETKILLTMPIDEYINSRLKLKERDLWEKLGYKYELTDTENDLGSLIRDITDFEIPLPSVGVLSIFGEPKITLKIGGAVDIHGAWRNETTEGVTASRLGNTRNEPDFKQQVQINVAGTIGDKLAINADWNTERTFEYENQLKIKYTGYEDEIIQSIEAGNVSLQTSPLVGGSEALFGVKAMFKLGPLTLTTLASQKKGEIKEVAVTGGTTSQDFNIRAYDYSTRHYFLDTIYASDQSKIFENYYANATPVVNYDLSVIDIEVWKSISTVGRDPSKERYANAYIDLPFVPTGTQYAPSFRASITPQPGQTETGRFLLLERDVDYTIHEETGFISFNTQINDNDIIAVAYRRGQAGGLSDQTFGEFLSTAQTDSQRLVLKLVKPSGLQPPSQSPSYAQAWKLLLKNIYPLGGRDVKQEGFEFQIKREIEGQDPVIEMGSTRFLSAFGLDKTDAGGTNSQPDGVFDYRPSLTIFTTTGEIVFPTLQPFGNNLPQSLPPGDSLGYPAIYTLSKTFAQQQKTKDKWLLTGKYSGSASSTYQLGFNVVENSVKVRLNGRELTAGADYIVDYNIGQLTIRNDAALVPGADLKITFEQNDLFQLASKTLLGARGVFDFSKKTKLGFSVLNLNQQTLSDKVRIGEEPLSNTIYGIDFSTQADLPFLTKLLDNVISTRQMSSFTVSGEYAYINPDPNTKKSTIASDKGKSIAYIDDFEGAKKIIPVGVSYTQWKDISPPEQIPSMGARSFAEMMDFKSKSFWFSITPSGVDVKDIWPKKSVAKQDQDVSIMDLVYIPADRGSFNYKNLQSTNDNWGGIMKVLSSTASNLVEENVEFIEFWIQIANAADSTKLYLDLGRISEDVIPNRKLDTEDKDLNDAIDTEGKEDTGLDGIPNSVEDDPLINKNITEPTGFADPSNDNFSFSRSGSEKLSDYYNINGTEGNAVLTDIGRLPDTEDLNHNGNIDLVNSYFRYEIPLDTNRLHNPYIKGGGDNKGWYLYRIPLKDTTNKVGNPTLTNVEFIRMFFAAAKDTVHLRFAEFNLVGSQWEKVRREDTLMSVSVVNLEDNPYYTIPPGVQQERDRSKPDEEVLRNEQSLNLIINGIQAGYSREAVRFLPRPLDVFNYKEMKLFIHGDENTGTSSVSGYNEQVNAEVYFRFGGDTLNYYEYRQPVRSGWNEISIIFDKLTTIKQQRGDTATGIYKVAVEGLPGHYYQIRGNPTLTSVKFLMIGIKNIRTAEGGQVLLDDRIYGEVWVNELRVIGADDSPGWAYSVATSLKLADLLTVNFNMSQTNPYFHKLSDRFGSRVESRNWSTSADLDVMKLLPINLPESTLKLNYSHTESVGKPLYRPGTDIKVVEAARLVDEAVKNDTLKQTITKTGEQIISESQTVSVSDSWSASNIKIKIPSNYWLIRDTWNALTFGFNYNRAFSRSPTVLSNKSWLWNANMNYALALSPDYYFYPANIPVIGSAISLFSDYRNAKIYFTPQTFSFTASAKRNRSTNVTRSQRNVQSLEITNREFTAARGFNFAWRITEGGFLNLSTTYNVNIISSLVHLEVDSINGMAVQRPESEIWKEILSGVFFGRDNQYQQTVDFRTSPRLPSLWDLSKFFSITAGYSASYQWQNDFRQVQLGRSAGFSSKTTMGLTLRWKSLVAPLFETSPDEPEPKQEETTNPTRTRGRTRGFENREQQNENRQKFPPNLADSLIAESDSTVFSDSLTVSDSTLVEGPPKKSAIKNALLFLKSAMKFIFFDYDNFTFNFSTDNSLSKSGLYGEGTGLKNFWGVTFND